MVNFIVQVRREASYELRLSVQFEVKGGQGVLSIPGRSKGEPSPIPSGGLRDLTADELRAGRFINLGQTSGGRRQSYAFSRLTVDRLTRLPPREWVDLEALTEFGFRYIIVPDSALREPVAAAAINMGAPSGAHARPAGALTASLSGAHARPEGVAGLDRPSGAWKSTVARPASVASASHFGARSGGRSSAAPEQPVSPEPSFLSEPTPDPAPLPSPSIGGSTQRVALSPELAKRALANLASDEAQRMLQVEMAHVQSLNETVSRLEKQLKRSEARERDLLELLSRWRDEAD